ncbi:MAG: hypothetical protein MJE77_31965 [Proteobacteria bacterium]|nr:hypothetical protein [Pseudomonadota bacterium]
MTKTQKRVSIALAATIAAAAAGYGGYRGLMAGDDGCPEWKCGGNSAQVIGYAIHLGGEPNEDQFRMVAFESRSHGTNPTRYLLDRTGKRFVDRKGNVARLEVKDSRFVIVDGNGAARPGEELSALSLKRRRGKQYQIVVEEVKTVQSWAHPPDHQPEQIPAYLLASKLLGKDKNRFCHKAVRWNGKSATPSVKQVAALKWHEPSFHAVLLGGEKYDRHNARVTRGENWLTIACAGSALAKMKLMGYDPQVSAGHPMYTTRAQRQATLKMITAKYCETDEPIRFTEDGTPLAWQNAQTWFQPPWPHITGVEAHWNPRGATCLNEPRHVGRKKVVKKCGQIPRCPQHPISNDPHYPLKGDNEFVTFIREEPAPNTLATTSL